MSTPEIILYPTESVYGLGVNPFDAQALKILYELKGRPEQKPVSWLVRNWADVEVYATVHDTARNLAEHLLPGPLTLVLPLRSAYQQHDSVDGTIGFRITTDQVAQKLIEEWYQKHNTPLTATSANVSGLPTLATIPEILAQFGDRKNFITRILDAGPRTGAPSTVVRINTDGSYTVHREGAIPISVIKEICGF